MQHALVFPESTSCPLQVAGCSQITASLRLPCPHAERGAQEFWAQQALVSEALNGELHVVKHILPPCDSQVLGNRFDVQHLALTPVPASHESTVCCEHVSFAFKAVPERAEHVEMLPTQVFTSSLLELNLSFDVASCHILVPSDFVAIVNFPEDCAQVTIPIALIVGFKASTDLHRS